MFIINIKKNNREEFPVIFTNDTYLSSLFSCSTWTIGTPKVNAHNSLGVYQTIPAALPRAINSSAWVCSPHCVPSFLKGILIKLTPCFSLSINSSGSWSKSSLILGSAFVSHHKVQDEIKYKKGFYEKVYKKIDEFNYRTLSNYFDNDESLYYKLTDEKRREEKMKEKEESNKEKDSKIEIKNIKIFDLKTNSHGYIL